MHQTQLETYAESRGAITTKRRRYSFGGATVDESLGCSVATLIGARAKYTAIYWRKAAPLTGATKTVETWSVISSSGKEVDSFAIDGDRLINL